MQLWPNHNDITNAILLIFIDLLLLFIVLSEMNSDKNKSVMPKWMSLVQISNLVMIPIF